MQDTISPSTSLPSLYKLKDAIQVKDHPYVQGLLSVSGEYEKEKTNDRSHSSPAQDPQARLKEWKERMKNQLEKDHDLERDR